MARPRKEGFEYFSFDVDFFWDRKIKGLKGRFGIPGIAVYIYILTQVYGDKGYFTKADMDLYDSIIADLGVTQEFTEQVMKFLAERSMLDGTLLSSDNVITAVPIQRRFQKMSMQRGKHNMIEVDRKIWLLTEEETAPFIKVTQNVSYSGKNPGYSGKNPGYDQKKPHKVKESKVKESKGNICPYSISNTDKEGLTDSEEKACRILRHYESRTGITVSSDFMREVDALLSEGIEEPLLIALLDYAVDTKKRNAHRYLIAAAKGCASRGIRTLEAYQKDLSERKETQKQSSGEGGMYKPFPFDKERGW